LKEKFSIFKKQNATEYYLVSTINFYRLSLPEALRPFTFESGDTYRIFQSGAHRATSIRQPEIGNPPPQPASRNMQSATHNQQPASSNQYPVSSNQHRQPSPNRYIFTPVL
jgi:hypothetical protein